MTWSAETRRLVGYPASVMPSYEAVLARVHPEDISAFRDVFESHDGGPIDFEHRFLLPDGTLRHMHVVAEPVVDPASGRVELIGAARDVTQAKRSAEAMRAMSADLAHVSRIATVGELTASITHEINQPLSAVRANAQAGKRWLEKTPPNVEEAIAAALRIERDSARASDIVRRMRALFTKTDVTRERVHLDDVARQVLAFTRTELQRDAVVPDLVVGSASDILVVHDPVQLQQVLLNLVLNARDAMLDVHARPRTLGISVWRRGSEVGVDVRDAGTGISEAIASNLFDAFHTTKKSGMGLGLSISRTIIEAHDGRIWAAPNPRHGATFAFAIPATVG